MDISALKSKRRYEINKGKKNFIIRRINATEYEEALYEITLAAYSQWPDKYRPSINKENFISELKNWNSKIVFGGFAVGSNELAGYAILKELEKCSEFQVLRVTPEAEKKGLNAALVAGLLEHYEVRLKNGFYINDGSRAIRHETAFQDYLEKYFGFRKAYCKLNIKYRFPVGAVVNMLYPFRSKVNQNSKIGSLVSGVLCMEDVCRNCR